MMSKRRNCLSPSSLKLFLSAVGFCCFISFSQAQLDENERRLEFIRRGHAWPPREEDYMPNTLGWKAIFKRRYQQLSQVSDHSKKYNGYLSAVHQSLLSKNFTEHGWGLTKAPQYITDLLVESLHQGLSSDPITEDGDTGIEAKDRPFFVNQEDLNVKIMNELLPLHEAWSGVKLTPNNAYGLRVYRNESKLNMHVDKSSSHIISSILHVDHDADGEPWPIVIEDFQGNTNEVFLESGDMLFYESSKCLHGRPKKFNGSWYSSLFIHYYPVDWDAKKVDLDSHYRVPPSWFHEEPKDPNTDELEIVLTTIKEPGCEHEWCAMKNTVKWHGPAPGYGKVLTAGGVVQKLENIPQEIELEKAEKVFTTKGAKLREQHHEGKLERGASSSSDEL